MRNIWQCFIINEAINKNNLEDSEPEAEKYNTLSMEFAYFQDGGQIL